MWRWCIVHSFSSFCSSTVTTWTVVFFFSFLFFPFISWIKLPASWCHLADWRLPSKALHRSLGVVTTAIRMPVCTRRFGLMRNSPAESSALCIQIKQLNMPRRKPVSSPCLFTCLFSSPPYRMFDERIFTGECQIYWIRSHSGACVCLDRVWCATKNFSCMFCGVLLPSMLFKKICFKFY